MTSTSTEARHRYRAPTDYDPPRQRFREPKHRAAPRKPKHSRPHEVREPSTTTDTAPDMTSGTTVSTATSTATNLFRYVLMISMTVFVAFGVRTYAIQMFFIPSESMEPTLCGGKLLDSPACDGRNDRILVNKVSYKLHDPQRRDVVVFSKPPKLVDVPDKDLVKRVIGIAGDTVTYDHNDLFVNGVKQVGEPYINSYCRGTPAWVGTIVVPKGEVFVMGDNRCNSEDSRYFGTIPVSSVVGKVFMVVWPWSRLGTI